MNAGRSLRAQLMRASMLTTGAALVLSAGAMLTFEYVNFRGERERDLRAQAALIARAVAPALVFQDPKSADLQLQSLRSKQGLLVAVVFDSSGAPFARYSAGSQGADQVVPGALPMSAPGVRHTGTTLELAYAIERETERVGTIYLVAEHDITGRIGKYAMILAAVVVSGLALAWFVFGRLQRVVTDPLSAVTRVAHEVMTHRDWSLRAPAAGSDSEDVTVLVEAFNGMLAEVEVAQASLLAADRKKDVFLATLAHELRNPLAPMALAVALLQRPDADPAKREKHVQILSRQLKQLTRLIDDLLDVSRIATGKLSLKSERLDVVAVVRFAVELIEPLARERNLQLGATLPAEPCFVTGDGARLQQVFTNLLTNACRYTPAHGHIDVVMVALTDQVQVSVKDDGIGIDPSLHEAVFELFEQADKRIERGNSGLGLGLTLARQLARLHGGNVMLDSQGEGHGSTFTVTLPRSVSRETSPETGTPAAQRTVAETPLSIVVADDNVDFAHSLQAVLEGRGHRVHVVHEGQLALDTIARHAPDAAILDIGMPGLNGYEVARQVRQTGAGRQVFLVAASGWGQASDKQMAAQAGFDHHLTKPIDIDRLVRLLEGRGDAASTAPRAQSMKET